MTSSEVGSQMITALQIGLVYASLALLTGNLLPLVIVHFLWDFVGLAVTQVPSVSPSASFLNAKTAVIVLQLVMGILSWMGVFVQWRRGAFRKS